MNTAPKLMVRHDSLADALAAAKRLGEKYGTTAMVADAKQDEFDQMFPFGVYLAPAAVDAYWAAKKG